jgi:hypothetical protein
MEHAHLREWATRPGEVLVSRFEELALVKLDAYVLCYLGSSGSLPREQLSSWQRNWGVVF